MSTLIFGALQFRTCSKNNLVGKFWIIKPLINKLPMDHPERYWPGLWFAIHTLAHEAKNYQQAVAAAAAIKCLLLALPCATCKQHAAQYLAQHPLEPHLATIGGLFAWTVQFHNAVSARVDPRKPLFTLAQAEKMYSSGNICTADCGHDANKAAVPGTPHGAQVATNSYNNNVYNNGMDTRGRSNFTIPASSYNHAGLNYKVVVQPIQKHL